MSHYAKKDILMKSLVSLLNTVILNYIAQMQQNPELVIILCCNPIGCHLPTPHLCLISLACFVTCFVQQSMAEIIQSLNLKRLYICDSVLELCCQHEQAWSSLQDCEILQPRTHVNCLQIIQFQVDLLVDHTCISKPNQVQAHLVRSVEPFS